MFILNSVTPDTVTAEAQTPAKPIANTSSFKGASYE